MSTQKWNPNINRKVKLLKPDEQFTTEILKHHNVSPLVAKILSARGLEPGLKITHFIQPSLKNGLEDPAKLLGLQGACDLISEAINKGTSIAIASDFDVDGLTSSAQVYSFLKHIGANVKLFTPDRFTEGYGLNARIINEAKEFNAKTLICLDFGTHNSKELTIAKELGMKTVVVDHHILGQDEKIIADAFINPQQPGCGFAEKILCTAGLAWYLVLGLKKTIKGAENFDLKNLLDLACLGTVCDMVPLIGVNRILAKRGLEALTNSDRPGIIALKEIAGIKKDVSCYDVSFLLGPRINAAGRMVNGEIVLELLTTTDKLRANKLATRLNKVNLERQDEEAKVKRAAISMVEKMVELPYGIVVAREDFHLGVVGIVAQRLVERFYRPSVVIGKDQEGIYKGSVRGIKGINVVEALKTSERKLVKFGGHENAGGLSIEKKNLSNFVEEFNKYCKEILTKNSELLTPSLTCDVEVLLDELSVQAVREVKDLAPFGIGNPGPVVLVRDLTIRDIKVLKGEHLKLELSSGHKKISCIWWKNIEHPKLKIGEKVDLAIKPDLNAFNGTIEVQGNIQQVL